jgi:hypothetical protein
MRRFVRRTPPTAGGPPETPQAAEAVVAARAGLGTTPDVARLPAFNSLSRCPKCGNAAGPGASVLYMHDGLVEWMRRGCTNCHYWWHEKLPVLNGRGA